MGCVQAKANEHEETDRATSHSIVSKPKMTKEKVTSDETQSSSQVRIALSNAESDLASIADVQVAKVKSRNFALRFLPGEICINEYGVAFYNFDGSNPLDPSQEIHLCKRYSEFKAMHAAISVFMASEESVKVEDQDKFQTFPALSSMPRANAVTYLLGRGHRKVEEREKQFVKILNAITAHPIAFKSKTFTEFLS